MGYRRVQEDKQPPALESRFYKPRTKGNAPLVFDRSISPETVAARTGVSLAEASRARQSAARAAAGATSGGQFNPFGASSKLRFEDLSVEDQQMAYRTVLGRRASSAELSAQQGSSIHAFIHGARPELIARREAGDSMAGKVNDIIGQWSKQQSGPSVGRQMLQMASIAGAIVAPGMWGAVVSAGSTLGFAAYDESQGQDVDWGRTTASAGLSLASGSANPFIRSGAAFGAGYAETGDLSKAALAGGVAGATTGQSTPFKIAGQMVIDQAVNEKGWAATLRNGGMMAGLAALPAAGGVDYSLMARLGLAVKSGNAGQIFATTVQGALSGRAQDRGFGEGVSDFTFRSDVFNRKLFATQRPELIARAVRQPKTLRPSPRPQPAPILPPPRVALPAAPQPAALSGVGVTRGDFDDYAK